jgi:hypothetical protein
VRKQAIGAILDLYQSRAAMEDTVQDFHKVSVPNLHWSSLHTVSSHEPVEDHHLPAGEV